MAGAKSKEKKGNCSIRSPSSAKRKYSDDEKLTVCIMYQYLKDTDKVAEYCDMPSSSVRYILKNNKKLREKAERLVLDISESGAAEFAERLQNTAMDAIETLLAAVVGDEAIAKSNSQQLAIAMPINTTETMNSMNVQTTGSAGVSPLLQATLNRYILKKAKEKNVFNQFGQRITVPKGKTKMISFDRAKPLDVSTEALQEGVTPKGDNLVVERLSAEPRQYGHYVAITDELDFYKHDPSPEVLKKTELLSDQAASIFDLLTLNVLKTGTNEQYCGGRESRENITADE